MNCSRKEEITDKKAKREFEVKLVVAMKMFLLHVKVIGLWEVEMIEMLEFRQQPTALCDSK